MTPTLDRAATITDRLRLWLLREAAPIWWSFGADHANGGFHERLRMDASPVIEPRRARVQARQVYAFATAGQLGWTGPAARAVDHGIRVLLGPYLRPDGALRTLVGPAGEILDDSLVLYDQAFFLLALAVAADSHPDGEALLGRAAALREHLTTVLAHPERGFEEAAPRTLPLKANPHMHLLEACLALEAAAPEDGGWAALADEIAELALDRFYDPERGIVREFFDGDWSPMPGDAGRIVEPGHLFEWAWLLVRWGKMRGHAGALAAARRLGESGERWGVDRDRRVVMNELLDDGSRRDANARLWPQTERIKAGVALAGIASDRAERALWLERAAEAGDTLLGYLETPAPGLWRDRMRADGGYVEEPAPASTFYHIVCAIEVMQHADAGR